MSFGTPILALGDPAQLPPIEGAGYFTEAKPDVMLTEVHRQAKESPVLRLATIVREGGQLELGTYGSSRVVPDDSLELNEILAADQVLVGRNSTRRFLNTAIREALGRETEMPVTGDRLVCLRNNHGLGVYNGGLYRVVGQPSQARFSDKLSMTVISDDLPDTPEVRIGVRPEFFSHEEHRLSKSELRKTHQFGYGYALTVHKAQGSQWDHVIIDNESSSFHDIRQRWLYTAITRAKKSVTIVRT
jgi:exodeoxyribonuclease-5